MKNTDQLINFAHVGAKSLAMLEGVPARSSHALSIGISWNQGRGAIALIKPNLKDSIVIEMPTRKRLRVDGVYSKDQKPSVGRNIPHDRVKGREYMIPSFSGIVNAIAELGGLAIPTTFSGDFVDVGTRNSEEWMATGLIDEAIHRGTGLRMRIIGNEWQEDPAISVAGRMKSSEAVKEALRAIRKRKAEISKSTYPSERSRCSAQRCATARKNKLTKEFCDEYMIDQANAVFGKNLLVGDREKAAALFIGMHGAMSGSSFVCSLPPMAAWATMETGINVLAMPTDIPFDSAIIHVSDKRMDEKQRDGYNTMLSETFQATLPPLARVEALYRSGMLVGKLKVRHTEVGLFTIRGREKMEHIPFPLSAEEEWGRLFD